MFDKTKNTLPEIKLLFIWFNSVLKPIIAFVVILLFKSVLIIMIKKYNFAMILQKIKFISHF